MEERYGKLGVSRSHKNGEDDIAGSDESSESGSESEDDEAELATTILDSEISATLNAIRSKDPRVYDKTATFYSEFDPDGAGPSTTEPKEKPMYLRDYHRQNLLEGGMNGEREDMPLQTYVQEQEALKNDIVKEMHRAAEEEMDETGAEDEDGGFLVRKPKAADDHAAPSSRRRPPISEAEIESADADPDTFLNNFMNARAWIPTSVSRFQPFDSDDSEEEEKTEAFEAAWNLRFEDPNATNANIVSHSRDAAAKYSVRREEPNARKRVRDKEGARKEAERREREEEKARLRRLRIEEMEDKVKRIREAAGLRGEDVNIEEWANVLDKDWEDDRWEEEMKKRFGDTYYAQGDEDDAQSAADSDAEKSKSRKHKLKKPKWDDDLDIKDIIPDFSDEDATKPKFTLSDEEDAQPATAAPDSGADTADEADPSASRPKSKKDRQRARAEQKRAARKERQLIESLVDKSLPLATLPTESGSAATSGFRYRETSPTAFGLTPLDILTASDTQLNEFVGLKKMAAFRDPEKKRRDRKKLSKKARLREWRREVYGGDEDGVRPDVAETAKADVGESEGIGGGAAGGEKKKQKKIHRSKKGKAAPVEA